MHMSSLPKIVFGSFPVCCCIDIIQKLFLHFYFHIDYTFNVVRNECIQMERSEFVWIFELRQIMQPNCSYYSRKSFIMISFGWNHRYITSTYILYDCHNNLFKIIFTIAFRSKVSLIHIEYFETSIMVLMWYLRCLLISCLKYLCSIKSFMLQYTA